MSLLLRLCVVILMVMMMVNSEFWNSEFARIFEFGIFLIFGIRNFSEFLELRFFRNFEIQNFSELWNSEFTRILNSDFLELFGSLDF